jgi:hypothetical protein
MLMHNIDTGQLQVLWCGRGTPVIWGKMLPNSIIVPFLTGGSHSDRTLSSIYRSPISRSSVSVSEPKSKSAETSVDSELDGLHLIHVPAL